MLGDYEVGDYALSELIKHWVSFYNLCLLLIIVISNLEYSLGYHVNQERIKREEEERATTHPGCGPGESVALCLNILSQYRLTARCSSGCHPSLHSLLTGG